MVVMFRGKGLRISAAEWKAYDPDVRVHFSPKAYYNDVECLRWAQEDLPLVIKGGGDGNLLFVDNLSGQTTAEFRQAAAAVNTKIHFLVGGTTDLCQPIDAGVGKCIQNSYFRARDEWLDDPSNARSWLDGIPVSAHRILSTKWLGTALRDLRNRPEIVASAAVRTGCAMVPNDPKNGVRLQGIEEAVIDYEDVGSDFNDASVDDVDEGVSDAGGSDSNSDAEEYCNGADEVTDASDASSDTTTDDEDDSVATNFDPALLIPHGHQPLPRPESTQDAIGKCVMLQVCCCRTRLRSDEVKKQVQDWWTGTVASNTDSKMYAAQKALGHTHVVRLDKTFERHSNGPFPMRSFSLWLEDYGTKWLLFERPRRVSVIAEAVPRPPTCDGD
eukprot:GHVU01100390.1.p1 GENE.GHVU01100390.1~~GHVU01100390.1.p1  ORF type:complete len:386 (-),score=44.60 GHVU01100390.1:2098-3255(-)